MDEVESRLAALAGRCSHEAFVALGIFRRHEQFEELLSQLERFTGRVALGDLEAMYCAMQYSKPAT